MMLLLGLTCCNAMVDIQSLSPELQKVAEGIPQGSMGNIKYIARLHKEYAKSENSNSKPVRRKRRSSAGSSKILQEIIKHNQGSQKQSTEQPSLKQIKERALRRKEEQQREREAAKVKAERDAKAAEDAKRRTQQEEQDRIKTEQAKTRAAEEELRRKTKEAEIRQANEKRAREERKRKAAAYEKRRIVRQYQMVNIRCMNPRMNFIYNAVGTDGICKSHAVELDAAFKVELRGKKFVGRQFECINYKFLNHSTTLRGDDAFSNLLKLLDTNFPSGKRAPEGYERQ